ncbi:MAG: hypothetical protein L6U99_04575 [Clostridium sp.]|nr:MAG: hypothetical protein L6U99_04575 [Clostridium sp.]
MKILKELKIGIGRSSVIPVVDYVLQKFPESELALINEAKEQAYLAVNDFIHEVDFFIRLHLNIQKK